MYTCTMPIRYSLSFLLCLIFSFVDAQNIGVGQWRVHFPYNSPRGFVEAEEQLYIWGDQGFFRYDKQSGERKILSKIDGFSDVSVSTMHYHESTKTLLIAYQNSVMDLLVNREELIQVPDIFLASINGSKEINHISAFEEYAILSCGFGIQVYNLKKRESTATWRSPLFTEVLAASVFQNKVYAATEQGIYVANLPSAGMTINPGAWSLLRSGNAQLLGNDGSQLWTVMDSILYRSDGTNFTANGSKRVYYKMPKQGSQLFLNADTGLFILSPAGIDYRKTDPASQVMLIDNMLYSASFGFGIIIDRGGNALEFISPSGPQGLRAGKMASKGSKIYIGGGFMFERGAPSYSLDGYYVFEKGNWTNSRASFNEYLDTFADIHAIALDPSGDLWLASLLDGIVRMRGNTVLEHYSPLNSPLKAELPMLITSVQVDDQRNLWVSNYESNYPLLVKTSGGVWDSFSLGNATTVLDMIITRDGNKWMKLRDKSGVSAGIMVYNDNGTPLDHSDDPNPKYLGIGAGNGNLPSAEVRCMTEDRNGQLWVGTAKGLAVFYSPSSIFTNRPSDARQIVIGEGDNVGYLLGDEEINAIYVDGGNRKWIASRSGLWLVSPDGQEVLANFNEENSPLLSNQITQLGMVEETGELFIATDKGIISYRTGSSAAGDVHTDVKVFPNPVKPDFDGPITISGLPQDAYVKITDISGNLIYETRANGGTATWNGRNFSGRKASTGVYMVFTANQDASDTFVSKILFIAP